jgi:hypothetical protein
MSSSPPCAGHATTPNGGLTRWVEGRALLPPVDAFDASSCVVSFAGWVGQVSRAKLRRDCCGRAAVLVSVVLVIAALVAVLSEFGQQMLG